MFSILGYAVNHDKKTKKKLSAPDISLTLDRSEGSVLSDELEESTELDLDAIDTPSDNSNEFEWEGKEWLFWENSALTPTLVAFSPLCFLATHHMETFIYIGVVIL